MNYLWCLRGVFVLVLWDVVIRAVFIAARSLNVAWSEGKRRMVAGSRPHDLLSFIHKSSTGRENPVASLQCSISYRFIAVTPVTAVDENILCLIYYEQTKGWAASEMVCSL